MNKIPKKYHYVALFFYFLITLITFSVGVLSFKHIVFNELMIQSIPSNELRRSLYEKFSIFARGSRIIETMFLFLGKREGNLSGWRIENNYFFLNILYIGKVSQELPLPTQTLYQHPYLYEQAVEWMNISAFEITYENYEYIIWIWLHSQTYLNPVIVPQGFLDKVLKIWIYWV